MAGSRGEEWIARLRAPRAPDPGRLAKKRERWYAFAELEPMLQSVCHDSSGDRFPPRLRRLFCAALCRRIWNLMPDDACRRNVGAAEADAEREVSREEQSGHWNRLIAVLDDHQHWPRRASLCALAAGVGGTSGAVVRAVQAAGGDGAEEERAHTDVLRDILGEWFDPVVFPPAWRTEEVLGLAEVLYRERAFDRLPELGEVLAGAGCAEPRVLEHCRSPGPHVRGCWVLDSVLGRREPQTPNQALQQTAGAWALQRLVESQRQGTGCNAGSVVAPISGDYATH